MTGGAVQQPERPRAHFLYMACCANGALYVGVSANVAQRLAVHNAGQGGRYTRANRPLVLLASWPFPSRAAARRAEYTLKRLPRERKLAIAQAAAALVLEQP
jgi:putative endonuclease